MLLWMLIACSGEPTSAPGETITLAEASNKITHGTMAELGSHLLEATIERTWSSAQGTRQATEAMQLRWGDLDNWSMTWSRDGRVRNEMVVYEGVAWTGSGGALQRRGDAEPYRVQLASSWDPWTLALDQFSGLVGLVFEGDEVIENRKAQRHKVTLLPTPPKSRRTWNPTVLEGTVWLDEALAVRLLGEIHGVAATERETLDMRLRFAVSKIGEDVEVKNPEGP